MVELEKRINKVLGTLAPQSMVGKALSGVKNTLKSSSNIVEGVNNFGDNIQDHIEEEVGGVLGSVTGFMASKAVKIGGGIAGGVVSATLKTVAGVIPDSSDIKSQETDRKIAHCIDTFTIPSDKTQLYEHLQYIHGIINSSNTPYGKNAMSSFKTLHEKIFSTFKIVAKDDNELIQLSKMYAPKKRFGIF